MEERGDGMQQYYDVPIPGRVRELEYPVPPDLSVSFLYDKILGVLKLTITAGAATSSITGSLIFL